MAPWEAALGAKVKAPTPSGIIDLKIPPDSFSGRKLRLQGRGIPGKVPGDLYACCVLPCHPVRANGPRRTIAEMAEELAFNPRASLGV